MILSHVSLILNGVSEQTTTILACLLELALNKEIQEKVREEIITETKKHDGVVIYDLLNHFNYLEMVLCGKLSNVKLVSNTYQLF